MQWELYGTHGKHNGLELLCLDNRLVQEIEGHKVVTKFLPFRDTTTRVTTTTTRRQRREGLNTQVIAQIDYESQGDRLRSTALIPFMRSKNITFTAQGMKPQTRVYPFFDKTNVTNFVYTYWWFIGCKPNH